MRRRALAAVLVAVSAWLLTGGSAAADNCANPNDCYATDSAATRAGQGLLALLLLYLLLQLLGRGAGSGWGWPGGGRDLFGGEGGPGDGDGGAGPGGVDNGSLTDRLLGWLDQAFGDGGGTILGGRVGGSDTLSGELFGADGRLTVTGEGIAELAGSAGVKLDDSGLAAELGLAATLGAQVGLTGSLQSGWITQTLQGTAFVGATAEATGALQLGAGGLGLHGEAEAFVGGKATGAYELDVGPAAGTVGGSVSFGLGYSAEGDVSFSWTNIGFSGKGGATVGLGAEAEVEISVNPEAIVDGISDALDFLGW